MKRTKQLLCLLLCAVLCLSLAACASEEDKAFEEACALLEAGDYDGALAILPTIGRYQEISAKIAEAEKMRDEANAGFLFGVWKDIGSGAVFTFEADGAATLSQDGTVTTLAYTYSDNTVTITEPVVLKLKVAEVDGITHITYAETGYDLVPEAEYEALAPYSVEITMDNWEEYFELRQVKNIGVNEFGEVTYSAPGYGVFLKEEYYDLLKEPSVDFEVTYDEACFQVTGYEGDSPDYNFIGEYTLIPTAAPYWWELQTGCSTTAPVYDQREWDDGNELNPYYHTIAAQFYVGGYWSEDGSNVYYCFVENAHISRVQGSLTFYRE